MVQTKPLRPEVKLGGGGRGGQTEALGPSHVFQESCEHVPYTCFMGCHMFQTALQLCGLQNFHVLDRGDFPSYQSMWPKQNRLNNLYLDRGGNPTKTPEPMVHSSV